MGYRHDRDEMLQAAMRLVLADGVGALTFGRVAAEVGASDRMVVYYFPTKADLIVAVVTAIGAQLQATLETAFGPDPLDADELMRRAWPVLASDRAANMFARFFEVIGLSLAGQAPYTVLAPALLDGWIDWLAHRVAAPTVARRQAIAASIVARLDGLLLLQSVSGTRTARAAARELGIAGHT
ncbi:MAG: TetR family transcriptional regulator [Actinomycetota bacterium]